MGRYVCLWAIRQIRPNDSIRMRVDILFHECTDGRMCDIVTVAQWLEHHLLYRVQYTLNLIMVRSVRLHSRTHT